MMHHASLQVCSTVVVAVILHLIFLIIMPELHGRVEVAENMKQGDIGTKLREGQAVTETARIAAENQKAQNKQKAEIAISNRELELIR